MEYSSFYLPDMLSLSSHASHASLPPHRRQKPSMVSRRPTQIGPFPTSCLNQAAAGVNVPLSSSSPMAHTVGDASIFLPNQMRSHQLSFSSLASTASPTIPLKPNVTPPSLNPKTLIHVFCALATRKMNQSLRGSHSHCW